MISVTAKDVSLDYRLGGNFTLARKRPRPEGAPGRIHEGPGGSQIISALKGVSFSLASGDRLALVGRNGAGKTTLLKVLYGIYEPTAGTVDVNGRMDALFNISLGFRPRATGRRNIMLRGLINGWPKAEIEEKMDDIIAFSELGEFIDMPIDSYSAGMAARLAFSVATALDPEILLMDEWIGAGDADFQEKARKRMWEVANAAGIVVLASHNRQLLQATCNKVLELAEGEVSFFGSAKSYFGKKT